MMSHLANIDQLSNDGLCRLCGWILGTCCRQLSYVEVRIHPYILGDAGLISKNTGSDVMSLIVALYAIKVGVFSNKIASHWKISHLRYLVDCARLTGFKIFLWLAPS